MEVRVETLSGKGDIHTVTDIDTLQRQTACSIAPDAVSARSVEAINAAIDRYLVRDSSVPGDFKDGTVDFNTDAAYCTGIFAPKVSGKSR